MSTVNKTKMMPWFCPNGEKKTIVGTLAAKRCVPHIYVIM
jgi:hypothetical protein